MNGPRPRYLFGSCALAVLSAAILGAQTIARVSKIPTVAGVSKTPTTTHAPDEFGTSDYTVTVIPALSFTPLSNDGSLSRDYEVSTDFSITFINNPSCLQGGELGELYAGVSGVPSGAIIDFIGLETYSPVAGQLGVSLTMVDRYGNQSPVASFSSTAHGFDTDYNVSPLGFQLSRNVHNQLVLNVEQAGNDTYCSYVLWVEIWWKRTVSPPPATATFVDVPTNDLYFQFIEALAASGVTGGCATSPPQYCPDRPITRAEMAVFLAKALGLHWPY